MAQKKPIDAAAPEIEITSEMLEMGMQAFRANETDSPNRRQVREAVVEIFVAMSQVACRRQA